MTDEEKGRGHHQQIMPRLQGPSGTLAQLSVVTSVGGVVLTEDWCASCHGSTFASIREVDEQAAVRGAFDRAAARYRTVGPDHFGYFAQLLVERIGIPSDANVLDVATGTGAVLAAVARQGSRGRLVGIDSSAAMLARAHRELCDSDVQLLEMDGQRLDLPEASFDIVCCSFGLQSFGAPIEALLAMRRVLTTSGRLGLVYPCGWHFLSDERWRWQVEIFARYGADIDMTEAKPEEIETLLNQAGFERIRIERAEYRLVFGSLDEWWLWSWSHGTRVLFEAVPSELLPALRDELQQGLRQRCTSDAGSIEGRLEAFVVTARNKAGSSA